MPTTFLKNPVSVNVSSAVVGLDVSGSAAASSSGAGAKPSNTLRVIGTAGQPTTGSGVAGGAGADISIAAGIGGAAPSGATNGVGGSVTINPGAPGAGAGTAGTYGAVLMATAGGRVGIGTAAPAASLDISGTTLATFLSTRAAAAAVPASFTMRKANTGMTAVTNGHQVTQLTFAGYDGSIFVSGARISAIVDGAVSGGIVPTAIAFSTGGTALEGGDGIVGEDNSMVERLRMTSAGQIGIGTASPTSMLHVIGGVQIGTPTGGDKGNGSINLSGDIYKNGTAYVNPDYVFEHHFNGSTEAAYAGPVPLANLEEALKTHGQLPGVGREPRGIFGRQDVLLEKLEEAYLYIVELTKRVDRLEAALEVGKERQ